MSASIDDIMRVLGRLEEGQDNAQTSRLAIHEKIDKTNETIALVAEKLTETTFNLQITTDIAVQTRDSFSRFKEKFEKEAVPVIEGAKTFREEAEPFIDTASAIQKSLIILIGVLGAGGFGFVGLLIFANNLVRSAVLAWLNAPL